MFGDATGFVRLDRTDEVPLQRQIGEFGHFVQGLLQVVLPETVNALRSKFAKLIAGAGFAHRKQGDRVRLSGIPGNCSVNALEDSLQAQLKWM